MTDELVKRLRSMHWCVTTEANGVGVSDRKVALEAADRIEALTAERDRLRGALVELVQQTHNCERELTEDLHHVDFCGESVPLTNAREALKGGSHE